MADRSVLEIPVDDAKFRRFMVLFEKYQGSLKRMPQTYLAQDRALEATAKKFGTYNAALLAQRGYVLDTNKAYDKQRNTLEHISRSIKDIGRGTKTVFRDIETGALSLAKWTGIAGLVGGGGLWGIDRLAQGVAGNRALALGTGSSYGGSQALRTQFGQYFNPAALAQAIGQASSDVPGFGMTAEVQRMSRGGMSTDQIELAMIPRALEMFRRNPTNVGMQTSGLDRFFSLEQMKMMSALPQGELSERLGRARADTGTFGLSDDTQQKWASLDRTLTEAGQSIETIFVKKLASLAPDIERLSKAVVHVAEVFADKLGPLIESFAGWLERHFGTGQADNSATKDEPESEDFVQRLMRKGREATFGATNSDDLMLLRKHMEGGETGKSNSSGAIGQYQIKQGTADQYGIKDNLWTAEGNESAASALLAKYRKMYNGNMAEVLVAYKEGSGVADKFRAAGDDLSMLPPAAQAYLKKASGLRSDVHFTDKRDKGSGGTTTASGGLYGGEPPSTAKTTNITITNPAGGNVINSANTVTQP